MNVSATKWIIMTVMIFGMLMLANCQFEEIDQPASVTAGEEITIYVSISTSDSDANQKWGLLGIMIPDDWVVNSVNYSGDFGTGTTHLLPADSSDNYPSAVDYGWVDSLEVLYPSGDLMHWLVYESDEGYSWSTVSYIDAEINLTVGNRNGSYDLGYFFTEGAFDFTDPQYWCDSLGNTITVTGGTAIDDDAGIIKDFQLTQNFPNPFNPTTRIQFDIPENAMVRLSVYDLMGHEVENLVNDYRNPGSYVVTFDGSELASGIYFYKLQAGNYSKTMKMVLAK